jgi:hypothetical protein
MKITYTPWKFHWHFDRATRCTNKTHGNFQLGIEVNRHPRFREYLLNLWFWSFGACWYRDFSGD